MAGLAAGLAVSQIQGLTDPKQIAVSVAVAGIAALVPDWLQVNIPGINKTVKGLAGHRGFSHWLLTAWLVYQAVAMVQPGGLCPPWSVLAGWTSHILLDALNNPGVPAFWPLPLRLHIANTKTGGAFDCILGPALVLLVFGIYLL
jgi:inner membrane protein